MAKTPATTGVDSATSSTDSKEPKPKPPIWTRLMAKTGLSATMCMLIFKAAVTPIIALSLFQWSSFAYFYTSIGYLVAIISILSFSMMPRAKFVQTMFFNVLGVCVGACINLLTCYCAVKARQHTTPPLPTTGGPVPGATTVEYNSSASAVAGIWLFFNAMFANAVRFKLPQFQMTIVIYSINANISAIYAPQFPTMAAAEVFVRKLLLAFMGGFGIATFVNLFVFPLTSRNVVQAQLAGYLNALKGVMCAERDYLQSMESENFMEKKTGEDTTEETPISAATKRLKASITGLTELHGKLAQDLPFAKREVAWGKLTAKDLDSTFKLLRQILLPCLGISSVADIFERVAEGHGWNYHVEKGADPNAFAETAEEIKEEQKQWSEIMKALHNPFQELVSAMSDALTHTSYALELTKRPQSKGPTAQTSNGETSGNGTEDIEAKAGSPSTPGDKDFGKQLESRIKQFSETNKAALLEWCDKRGLRNSPQDTSKDDLPKPPNDKDRRQLYMILYMEFLLWSSAQAVLQLARFADKKVASGQMKRSRLLFPGSRRLKKWLLSCFMPEDSSVDHTPDSAEAGFSNMAIPNAFRKRKDPEHLEPKNAWERFGELLRKLTAVFASQEVAFGFRVACATLSVGIMAFLEQTQQFFIKERLFWAQIIVAISMTFTSGSGIFGFTLRLCGTTFACCFSLAIWYIAGGRGIPGALLPILFLVYLALATGMVKYPRYVPVFMVTMITHVLVLGYELEADKVGLAILTSNGQAYHPIYILAWIRLATVSAGLFVAFFWTYIPYPLTAKNAMRQRLADSIFLLACYYSCVHATIGLRIEDCGGDPDKKDTPAHRLRKIRFKLVPKMLGLLTEMRQHLAFTSFEFEIGGRFPKKTYQALITEVNNVFNYMSLIDYATATYATARGPDGQYTVPKEGVGPGNTGGDAAIGSGSSRGSDGNDNNNNDDVRSIPDACHGPDLDSRAWLHDLARVQRSTNLTTEGITSLLSLLSSSIGNAQPLPPFLRPPKAYLLTSRIRDIDPDILSIRHVTEPGYAAFAVTQVASRLISSDMARLLDNVRALVGEVDFSYHPAHEDALKMGEDVLRKKDKTE